jgi:hypothetical protein
MSRTYYDNISTGVIIDKIYRDLDFGDGEKDRWMDMIEWIGEALEDIQILSQTIEKQTTLTIDQYRAFLPCDFYEIRQVTYGGKPLHHGLGKFDHHLKDTDRQYTTPYSYSIAYPYMNLSLKSGEIVLSYWALPVDEDGFPLVPDHYDIKEALFWYVLSKLALGGWKHNDPNINHMYCKQQYKLHKNKANAFYNFPTPDKVESIKRMLVRLIPEVNQHAYSFSRATTQEDLKFNRF